MTAKNHFPRSLSSSTRNREHLYQQSAEYNQAVAQILDTARARFPYFVQPYSRCELIEYPRKILNPVQRSL